MRRLEVPLVVLLLLLAAVGGLWSLAAIATSPVWAVFWDNCHWTLAYGGAAVLAAMGMRRAAEGSPERQFRFWLTLALGSYTVGQVLWDLQVATGWNPFPGPSDLFYLSLGPILLWGLHRSLNHSVGSGRALTPWVDTLLLTLGLVAPLLAVYLPLQGATDWLAFVVMLLYPLFLLATLSLSALIFLFNDNRYEFRRLVFLATILGSAIVWLLWNYLTLLGALASGTVLNLSFSVVTLLLGWSGSSWTWTTRSRTDTRPILVLLPLLGLLTSTAGLVAVLALQSVPPATLPLFFGMALLSVVLAFARQVQLIREVLEVGRLKDRSRELEETVRHLKQTQDQLIQSEKLAALGELIAGIAHDLNTPLGAIRSAASQLMKISEDSWIEMQTQWDSLDASTKGRVTQWLKERGEQEFPDGKEERALRKEWTERARDRGHPQPERFGHAVVEAGLQHQRERASDLLDREDPYPLLEVLTVHRTVRQLVSLCVRASDRASGVITALRHYLHTTPEGDPVVFDLSENIREVLPLFAHRVRVGAHLNHSIDVGLFVLGRPEQLSQVWVNLLTNAFQAIASAGAVTLRACLEGASVVVEVEDDGPGIAPEHRDKIFQPFFTTKGPGDGTGLGLDVCRRIVTECGGTITFESLPGRTVFRVTLPVAT